MNIVLVYGDRQFESTDGLDWINKALVPCHSTFPFYSMLQVLGQEQQSQVQMTLAKVLE